MVAALPITRAPHALAITVPLPASRKGRRIVPDCEGHPITPPLQGGDLMVPPSQGGDLMVPPSRWASRA